MQKNNYGELLRIVPRDEKEQLKELLKTEDALLQKLLGQNKCLNIEFPSWQLNLNSLDDLKALHEALQPSSVSARRS